MNIYAIEIILQSHEPFQSYLIGQADSAFIFIAKLVSVEMACLLGIQNEIQAVWDVYSWERSLFVSVIAGKQTKIGTYIHCFTIPHLIKSIV